MTFQFLKEKIFTQNFLSKYNDEQNISADFQQNSETFIGAQAHFPLMICRNNHPTIRPRHQLINKPTSDKS